MWNIDASQIVYIYIYIIHKYTRIQLSRGCFEKIILMAEEFWLATFWKLELLKQRGLLSKRICRRKRGFLFLRVETSQKTSTQDRELAMVKRGAFEHFAGV